MDSVATTAYALLFTLVVTPLVAQEPDCTTPGQGTGDLTVRVVDESGAVPLPGVRVSVSWNEETVTGTTEGDGAVRICGVPADSVTVAASLPPLSLRTTRVAIEAGGHADVELRLDLASRSEEGATGRVLGRVVDAETLAPVEAALVGTEVLGYGAVTNGEGTFRLDGVASGRVSLRVRHVAYGERENELVLAPGQVLEVELRMTSRPIALDTLAVEIVGERSLRLDIAGFYERRDWMTGLGLGHFVTREDIERRRPLELSHLLGSVPRVDFTSACPGSRCAIPFIAGTAPMCRDAKPTGEVGPSVYVDGHRLRLAAGAASGARLLGIDELARPADVAGIEVYTGLGDLPGEFADPHAQRCGAIVIWTGN